MNRSMVFLFATLLTFSAAALGADGLVAIKSPFSAKETINRFEENAKQGGLNVCARVDHAGAVWYSTRG